LSQIIEKKSKFEARMRMQRNQAIKKQDDIESFFSEIFGLKAYKKKLRMIHPEL